MAYVCTARCTILTNFHKYHATWFDNFFVKKVWEKNKCIANIWASRLLIVLLDLLYGQNLLGRLNLSSSQNKKGDLKSSYELGK